MTAAKQVPLCYLNGDLIPFSDAKLPIFDLAIMQGATVTERLRTFCHELYAVEEHLQRLKQSLGFVNWDVTGIENLEVQAREIVAHNCQFLDDDSDLAVVIFVTAGQSVWESQGLLEESQPTVCVYSAPLPFAKWANWYESGVDLVIPDRYQIPKACLDPRIKNRSRLHWLLADQAANRESPGSQALLLDAQGFATETSSGNLVVVQDGVCKSPPLETVLNGTMLAVVENVCLQNQIEFRYENLTSDDLANTDEAFLTSSTYVLAPVANIQGVQLKGPCPGPVTMRLSELISAEVGTDFRAQAVTQ